MSAFLYVFQALLGLLEDTKILNIPLLVWFLAPLVVVMIVKFVQGKK